jgi:hypothetical protein
MGLAVTMTPSGRRNPIEASRLYIHCLHTTVGETSVSFLVYYCIHHVFHAYRPLKYTLID